LIKKSLIAFSPIEVVLLRITVSFVAAIPFLIKAVRVVPHEKYFTILQIGVFGTAIPALLFAIAMTKTGSAVNGILNSLSPLWTLLIGYFLFNMVITTRKVSGVLIGFGGALLLVVGKTSNLADTDWLYASLPLAATFCYGLSSNLTKQKLQNQNPLYTTSLAMAIIGIPAIIGLLFTNAPQIVLSGTAWISVGSIVFLAVFGTFIAWMLFYRLVQRTDALFAASVTYLIPLVAILWGLLDGEHLSPIQFGGMMLILLGVYFTTTQKSKPYQLLARLVCFITKTKRL
jgi:drug/metabolite transporter (DMT)-like permease